MAIKVMGHTQKDVRRTKKKKESGKVGFSEW